jgi:tRNA threonylcarbamoyladenosine biosynthesis protein TsaE
MTGYKKTFSLGNETATRALGAALATHIKPGDIIALRGDLGAGKTSLARGLIGALCGAQEVPSPTYTLVQTYDGPSFGIWHFDLYRLDDPGDVWELGIEEALEDGVCLIEWPERIESLLSGAELNIEIEFDGDGRTAIISGNKQWGSRLAKL